MPDFQIPADHVVDRIDSVEIADPLRIHFDTPDGRIVLEVPLDEASRLTHMLSSAALHARRRLP